MDLTDVTEEFIRRESKPELPDLELNVESILPDSELELEPEISNSEVALKPETSEVALEPETSVAELAVEPECQCTVTRTEFDAVHPRFRKPQKPEVIEEFQSANDYYCEQCKLYFVPTVEGLKTHFKGDMVKHQAIDQCFYCSKPVYAYSFNREKQIYHNCEDASKEIGAKLEQKILVKSQPSC